MENGFPFPPSFTRVTTGDILKPIELEIWQGGDKALKECSSKHEAWY
jgi:hypothetical protein